MDKAQSVPINDVLAFDKGMREIRDLRKQSRVEQDRTQLRDKIQKLRKLREKIKDENPEIKLDQEGEKNLQERYTLLQSEFLTFIKTNPDATRSELDKLLEKLLVNSNEKKIILAIFSELKEKRKRSQALLARLRREAEKELKQSGINYSEIEIGNRTAQLLFEGITGTKPINAVTILENPFAVTLVAKGEDSQKLLESENTRGQFADKTGLNLGASLKLLFFHRFPFVFLDNYTGRTDIITASHAHEQGHVENRALISALKKTGPEILEHIWSGSDINSWMKLGREFTQKLQKKLTELRSKNTLIDEAKEKYETNEILSDLKKGLWQMSLGRAKDEILADLIGTGGVEIYKILQQPIPEQSHWGDQKNPYEAYHFLKMVGISPKQFNTPELQRIFISIVKEYNEVISQNAEAIKQLLSIFSEAPQLKQKQELRTKLIAFMRQNPLNTWKTKGFDFFREDILEIKQKSEFWNNLRQESFNLESKLSESLYGQFNQDEFNKLIRESPQIESKFKSLEPRINDIGAALISFRNEIRVASEQDQFNEDSQQYFEGMITVLSQITTELIPEATLIQKDISSHLEMKLKQHPLSHYTEFRAQIKSLTEKGEKNREHILSKIRQFIERVTKNEHSTNPIIIESFINGLIFKNQTIDDIIQNLLEKNLLLPRQIAITRPILEEITKTYSEIIMQLTQLYQQNASIDNVGFKPALSRVDEQISTKLASLSRNKGSGSSGTSLDRITHLDQVLDSLEESDRQLISHYQQHIDEIEQKYEDIQRQLDTIVFYSNS